MQRLNDIQQALATLVGWRQSYNPARSIDAALTESTSGLYFQDAHPLLTLDNVREILPDDWGLRYPEWSDSATYAAGDKVRYNGTVWTAVASNSASMPGDDSPVWRAYDMLSDYLHQLTAAGIATVVQTFMQMKQLRNETRTLMERRALFDGVGRLKATILASHKLVGFEIEPLHALGVTAKIERIGLQMTGATGTVRLYLFHSSQAEPIRTFNLDFTNTRGGFQWFTLDDCYLPYMGGDTNAGGAWFLVYNQDELPVGMEAINVAKDWSREPCGTCNQGSLETWREMTKYLRVSPFMIGAPSTFTAAPELWDVARMVYTNTTSYGLNAELSIGCDLTDFFIAQKDMFATVIQRQVAAMALRTMALNPNVRVNRNQSNVSRMDILYELDGNTAGRPSGLGYELRKAYEALALDTRGIDRVCLACNNGGVRYRAV